MSSSTVSTDVGRKKFGDIGVAAPLAVSGGTGVTGRKVSALQAQAQHMAQGGKRGPRLSTVVQPIAPIASMEVMTNNFEEWMKLATDNVSCFERKPPEGTARSLIQAQ